MNLSAACEAAIASYGGQGLVPAAYQFNMFLTVFVPVSYVVLFAVFVRERSRSWLVRKRSRTLVLISMAGAMANWATISLREAVGPSTFPCIAFGLLNDMVVPLLVTPLLMRLTKAQNAIALAEFANQKSLLNTPSGHSSLSSRSRVDSNIPVVSLGLGMYNAPQITLATVKAYMMGGTRLRTRKDGELDRRTNALRFASSRAFVWFWVFWSVVPFVIAFIIKVQLDARWRENCLGCDLDLPDLIFFMASVALLTVMGCVLLYTFYISKKDKQHLTFEFLFAWLLGGGLALLSIVLFIVDPGQLNFGLRVVDWRWLTLLSSWLIVFAQTGLVVILARRDHRILLGRMQKNMSSTIQRDELLRKLLLDKTAAASLREHLAREQNTEILLFLESVDTFVSTFNLEGRQLRAREIYDVFVQPRAPLEINISYQLRDALIQSFKRGNVEVGVFKRAYEEVWASLRDDAFPRFVAAQHSTRHMRQVGQVVSTSSLSSTNGTGGEP